MLWGTISSYNIIIAIFKVKKKIGQKHICTNIRRLKYVKQINNQDARNTPLKKFKQDINVGIKSQWLIINTYKNLRSKMNYRKC